MFSVARRVLKHKSPDHGDVSNHDLTPQGKLLLNICSNPEGDRRHIAEEKEFVNHGPALKCIDQGSGETVELKEGDHVVEHGQGVGGDPNINWHMSYPTFVVKKPKSTAYPMMLKRITNWDDCEHSWHCMHPMEVDKACIDKLLKPRCNKGSCIVPTGPKHSRSGEWLCQKLTALPDEVDAAAIAKDGGMDRGLRRRLRGQRPSSYLDSHTDGHMLPPLQPDGGAAPAKTTSSPEPVVPFTPPLPPDWFASFSEKKQKGIASEKLHKSVYGTTPDKSKKPKRSAAVYLAADGTHCSHDFRVSEEVSDEECAMRVSTMLEPADADVALSNPNEN